MKHKEVDWTPIEDIKPARVGKGYSMFSTAEMRRIRQFINDNHVPCTWVARYFGVGPSLVTRMYNGDIKGCRNVAQPRTDDQWRMFHKKHIDGMMLSKVAREAGCNVATVRFHFQRLGLEITNHWLKIDHDAVERLLREGKTHSQIAKTLGIKRQSIPSAVHRIRRRIIAEQATGGQQ